MFNNTTVFKGSWVALMDNAHPTGKGWELYNIETDSGQNNNVADQNPDLLKQMIADYQTFAEEVGVVGKPTVVYYSMYATIVNKFTQCFTVKLIDCCQRHIG